MKTILNDATFIFVYLKVTFQVLRCKELLSVIRPCNVILFLWNKEKKLVR